jgi:hypothetical protein
MLRQISFVLTQSCRFEWVGRCDPVWIPAWILVKFKRILSRFEAVIEKVFITECDCTEESRLVILQLHEIVRHAILTLVFTANFSVRAVISG